MINSTLCPLCKDGIGHKMDDFHALLVSELLNAAKSLIQQMGDVGAHQCVGWDCAICRALSRLG